MRNSMEAITRVCQFCVIILINYVLAVLTQRSENESVWEPEQYVLYWPVALFTNSINHPTARLNNQEVQLCHDFSYVGLKGAKHKHVSRYNMEANTMSCIMWCVRHVQSHKTGELSPNTWHVIGHYKLYIWWIIKWGTIRQTTIYQTISHINSHQPNWQNV